jgi:hypothetical protein
MKKMSRFDDKLSVILDNSKNNSFFSNNRNNISLANKSINSDLKNNAVINSSFRSLHSKSKKVLDEKISKIEEKMSKIKKNGSFDTIILNNITDNNKTNNKDKFIGSIISSHNKIVNNLDKHSANTPLTENNKVIKHFNQIKEPMHFSALTNIK